MMVASRSGREVPKVTVGDHFDRVAAVYESLRTTDEAPVRRIGQLLPDRPVTGLDIGCGTGRYSRLLRTLLPDGSMLAGSSPRSSREYRPVPQPISRPVTGRSGSNWTILRTGAASVVRSDS